MTDHLHVSLIQSDLHWENPMANRAMFEEKIWDLAEPTDIIILPEMFTTGFSMRSRELAEAPGLDTVRWMKQMAAQTGAAITGSYIASADRGCYNRLLWVYPDGTLKTYDKRHLFRMAGEDRYYRAGGERLILEWKGWSICPLVCYDLRFPVWSRNRWDRLREMHAYDLLLYVAEWPAARAGAWEALLRARAIENLAYCVGLNRVGTDGNGIDYAGGSAAFDPKGNALLEMGDVEGNARVMLDREALIEYRSKFPAHLDADDFEWKP